MSIINNIILTTDSYKVGHAKQYPPKTENVYSYFESRGGLFPETVFFGLQYILRSILSEPVTMADVSEAAEIYEAHFGSNELFNRSGWESLVAKHRGTLPVRIKAVSEGTVVPVHNVLMTVENTDPEFPWLTNYLETILSQVWYPTTVATLSYFVRQKILQYLVETGDPSGINFKLHDFGFRGVSSLESATIGGAAHLTSFMGTDTVPALMMLRKYYGADIAGFSVPASEHSTMTSWGGPEGEIDAMRNMVKQYGDYPIYSVVSDSYDIYNAVEKIWGWKLKDDVLNAKGTLVVRPDSGDPPKVVTQLLEDLARNFGSERNEKGYKVLNPKIRLIWGDGLEPCTIETILARMKGQQWSADNITFGMGGGLLQKVNRDTQKFAFKCSSVVVDGEERNVYKQPIGDTGKDSKPGRMALLKGRDGHIFTAEGLKRGVSYSEDLLETVYDGGNMTHRTSLDEIRQRTGMRTLTPTV